MPRPKSGDKPRDIRIATVAEVVAVGSTAVSVNKIAQRAGLSVGTLYRYHDTKDALLWAVYLDIKRDIHGAMMAAAAEHTHPADRLRAIWFAMIAHGLKAPGDFQMAEMMGAEIRAGAKDNTQLQDMRGEVIAEVQAGIDAGVLVDMPAARIETVMAAPALSIARQAALSGVHPETQDVEDIFTLIWRGIARNP